jgi:hypothetical protein
LGDNGPWGLSLHVGGVWRVLLHSYSAGKAKSNCMTTLQTSPLVREGKIHALPAHASLMDAQHQERLTAVSNNANGTILRHGQAICTVQADVSSYQATLLRRKRNARRSQSDTGGSLGTAGNRKQPTATGTDHSESGPRYRRVSFRAVCTGGFPVPTPAFASKFYCEPGRDIVLYHDDVWGEWMYRSTFTSSRH